MNNAIQDHSIIVVATREKGEKETKKETNEMHLTEGSRHTTLSGRRK
jgi:hypothetical protein